jgi:hypothetical protein
MRDMRMRSIALLVGLVALAGPWAATAQDVVPRSFVGPLSHPRYEDDGVYTALEFLFWKQTNPLKNQPIATRGFLDVTGGVTGTPGTFVGSNDVALSTEQLRGPTTFTPGYNLTLGYRWQDGIAIQASWVHLIDARYNATAGAIGPGFNLGDGLENTVLSAPVVNLPPQFSGNQQNLGVGGQGATSGIFNAATYMQTEFKQRFDMFEGRVRVPVMQTDNWRSYGLFGPKVLIMWERFSWRSVDMDQNGNSGPSTNADYTNVVSNRLYGLFVGSGNEFRLGDSPLGTFSAYVEVGAALYADIVKTRAQYSLEDHSFALRRNRAMWTLAPGLNANVGFNWYIYEAITIRLGYNGLALFDTVASPRPIDFNAGGMDPGYSRSFVRVIDGLNFGVGLVW